MQYIGVRTLCRLLKTGSDGKGICDTERFRKLYQVRAAFTFKANTIVSLTTMSCNVFDCRYSTSTDLDHVSEMCTRHLVRFFDSSGEGRLQYTE